LDKASFEQRRSLVELLVDRVIVADGEVEIRYVMPTDRAGEQERQEAEDRITAGSKDCS
jgi:site-specific DNA recombinase